MKTIRILLADDHKLLRAALQALLSEEPGFEVVGEDGDGREAVNLAEALQPDVVVMDISMSVMDGLEATRLITSRVPSTRVLALSMHTDAAYVLEMVQAGGSGYVLKRSTDTDLIRAIRAVVRGEVFLYPDAMKQLLASYGSHERTGPDKHQKLSERESTVLKLTAEGYSNHEIAQQLAISSKTVDTYRQRISEKLDLHHRAELVHYALDRGLLQPSR